MEFIKFYQEIQKLKEIKRAGWVKQGVPNPESVADHNFGISILALTVPIPTNIDRNRLIKMALVEEFGETSAGDIIWEIGKNKDIKKKELQEKKERQAVENLFNLHKNNELKSLALEYLEQKTEIAQFLKQLDKLEMAFQALAYEKKINDAKKFDEFFLNAEKYIHDENLLKVFKNIKKQRTA